MRATESTMINGDTAYTFFSQRTPIFNLQLWVIICICVVAFIIFFLFVLCICILSKRKTKRPIDKSCYPRIPVESKEISTCSHHLRQTLYDNISETGSKKPLVKKISMESDSLSQCSSVCTEESPFGWGHWFTLRDLEHATNHFCKENVIGEGGYGVVYKGCLFNGMEIAVKRLLCNVVQAEREFRVEVEAIAHVRHKNLVRFLGYCAEGTLRMLVYEYVNNGNLDQWLHGDSSMHHALRWESRMKIILGTAKALAYLHEAVEPKVVHRDIKSSNILLDAEFNAKISDFGLAKLMGAGENLVETRVMGTFGYVAPEYAYSGMLNEKSDVYSFGVLMLEVVTGRGPIDFNRVKEEVNLVEWFKTMVCSRKTHELMDPNLDPKPTARIFKRILLVALKCIDLDSGKRPKMSQVVRMLEIEDEQYRQGGRRGSGHSSSWDITELDNILESSN